jgi:hypothetical protein
MPRVGFETKISIKTIKIKPSFATSNKMYLFLLITTCFGSHKWPSSGDSRDTKYQSRSYYSYNGSVMSNGIYTGKDAVVYVDRC